MAQFVLTAKQVQIAAAWTGTAPGDPGTQTISGTLTSGIDISQYVDTGAEVGWNSDMVEKTNMASGGFRSYIAGLSSGDDIQIPLQADFAASAMWDDLQTVFGSLGISRPGSSEAYIDIKADDASRGATNPSFVAAVLGMGVQPIQGGVGDLARHGLTLKVTGAFTLLES